MVLSVPDGIIQLDCDVAADDKDSETTVKSFVLNDLMPIIPVGAQVVTFDGFDGVGKSTLAHALAEKSNRELFSLDDFLNKNRNSYLPSLQINELQIAVNQSVRNGSKLILEGCMMRAVMAHIDPYSAFNIYVLRTSRMRMVPEYEHAREHDVLYGNKSAAEIIANERKNLASFNKFLGSEVFNSEADIPALQKELILYHRKMRPHEHAEAMIKLIEWDVP